MPSTAGLCGGSFTFSYVFRRLVRKDRSDELETVHREAQYFPQLFFLANGCITNVVIL
jgi:hypothetical protein